MQTPKWRTYLCSQPYLLYALLAQCFDQQRIAHMATGVHPSAIIADDAQIDEGVSIGPYVVIESGVHIATGARIGAGCFIGPGCAVGRDGILYPRVTLYQNVRIGDRVILHSGVVDRQSDV